MQKLSINIFRISVFICASFIFPLIFSVSSAQAQGLEGVLFDSFESIIDVNEKESTFTVTETISGEFSEYRHGIFRFIPYRYTNPDSTYTTIKIKPISVSLNGNPEPFESSHEGAFEVLKIGDADKTFDGKFKYKIVYKVERAILFHEINDEIYWNVSGAEWGDNFEKVSATLLIDGVKQESLDISCYTGEEGSTAMACNVTIDKDKTEISANDFLTISVLVPKGILFEPSSLYQLLWWAQDNWRSLFWLLPFVSLIILIYVWFKYGRDSKGRGTIVPVYQPPKHLTKNGKSRAFRPAEMGTLLDAKLHPLDMSATLVDLAVRGYLVIGEKEKKLFGSDYALTSTGKERLRLRNYEQEFIKALFGGKKEVKLADRRVAISNVWEKIEKQVYSSLANDGYFVKNPQSIRSAFLAIGIFVSIFGLLFDASTKVTSSSSTMWLAFLISGVLIALFGRIMPKKTRKGTLSYEEAKGFQDFLKTALRYRIEWEEKEDIFESYLPYAMVFGVAKKWANAVSQVQGQESISAQWFNSSAGMAFNVVSFTSHVQSFVDELTEVSTPSSSGGSISSGGGFSGGGFGGGGGGSW